MGGGVALYSYVSYSIAGSLGFCCSFWRWFGSLVAGDGSWFPEKKRKEEERAF